MKKVDTISKSPGRRKKKFSAHDNTVYQKLKRSKLAPGEGQIPVSVRSEPDWVAIAFPKEFSTGTFHHNHPQDIKITPINTVCTNKIKV